MPHSLYLLTHFLCLAPPPHSSPLCNHYFVLCISVLFYSFVCFNFLDFTHKRKHGGFVFLWLQHDTLQAHPQDEPGGYYVVVDGKVFILFHDWVILTAKLSSKCRDCPYPPAPAHAHIPPLTSPTSVVRLLNWHTITTESVVYIRFILGHVHYMCLDNCVLTCIHHYSIRQSISTALKIVYAPPSH